MAEYPIGKISDYKDGHKQEVAVGSSKVLISKIDGQIYATSSKCTHYGAPLAKGVLSYEGRITCPWHGACFNVKTGDIEDSPGMDNLQSFKVIIKDDDNVYVEVDEAGKDFQSLKAGRRPPKCIITPTINEDTLGGGNVITENDTIVILGGGASGNSAAEKLRETGYCGRVVLVSREPYLPIDRPKLSKNFGFGIEKLFLRNQAFYDQLSITLKLGTAATKVDPTSKSVSLDNGEELKYNSLIIATGADPRSIPVPGIDLKNVLYLRTFNDYKKIEGIVNENDEKKNLVIIGSSFIGMEVAAMSSKKAKVSVIGMEKVPFERVLGEKVGKVFQTLHESHGIKFHLKAGVTAIEPSETDPTVVGAVVLGDGTKIKADIVVVGAGVIPSTGFLKGTPEFKLEKDGGIKVTDSFQVEGLKDVYAIGDIAKINYSVTGEPLRIEHWSFAENTGRAVAEAIVSRKIIPFKKIPYFWSNQLSKGLRYCGYASSFDDVIVQGSLEEMKFAAFYASGDKILAVATMSSDPIASHCSELFRLGKFPTATEIRNGKSPIDVPLTA
ncbi:14534_t:CDS:10 [Funneliformis geosporum]|uniref:12688_t:CDS:1 n=1 Tax=Funneliformis geosporum TaxID=1117311 RepID=A0A9W4WPV2_9GLOM|nr:12688_t:CDS:10 [Funneliformis geosporum]CAI2165110.1 14534_t:CDS:10 [Funneliformis geosporum]